MKVQANQTQASSKAQISQEAAQEYHNLIVMKLLDKAYHELLVNVEHCKLEVADSASRPSKGKSASKGASTIKPQAPHKEDAGDAILDALIAQLSSDEEMNKLSKEVVSQLLNYTLAQLQGLKNLQNEIQALENQLKNNLTPSQVSKIKAQLASLEAQYETALGEYNSASDDYNKNKQAAASAQNDYNQAEAAYNKIQDKSSPEAKQLKQQMEADQKKMSQAHKSMDSDTEKMAAASGKIDKAINGLATLAKQYPVLSANIETLITAMKNKNGAAAIIAILNNQVNNIANQDNQLQQEIDAKQQQVTALIGALSHGSDAVKKALKAFTERSGEIDEAQLAQLVVSLITTVISDQVDNHQNEQDQDSVARANNLTSATRHRNPVNRIQAEKSTHQL